MHSAIVALLCLTLFVDSAKACWWLRQHRSRAQVCRPAACRAASLPCCAGSSGEIVVHGTVAEAAFADGYSGCDCGEAVAGHAIVEHAIVEHEVPQAAEYADADRTVEHRTTTVDPRPAAGQAAAEQPEAAAPGERANDSVVVHGPTIVVDAAPRTPAGDAEPKSVVAQPMPVTAAGPAILPKPTPAGEPIPELKPAIAPVAPVSNEQPSPEPPTDAQTTAAASAEPAAPMPAPLNNLAGGPQDTSSHKTAEVGKKSAPSEPNLFDLYADEADDEPALSEASPADAEAAEPADSVPADSGKESIDASATEKPKMADAEAAEEAATDEATSEESPASADEQDNAGTGEKTSTEKPAAGPAEPAKDEATPDEADPFKAAQVVPDEPMRRWADDTGSHHAQGWLVEVRADSVRILKVNGRHTTVSRESLSAADRAYVAAVGERLAAQQGTTPATTTTAGL